MAEDVARASSPAPIVEPASARLAPGRGERARASGYYLRFSLAYMVLAMVAAAGIATLVVVLTRPGGVRAPAWSRFEPTGSPVAQVRQIATRVSAEYRASTGRKLVTVLPGPLQATRFLQTDSGPVSVEVPITALAVQPDVSTGKHEEGDFTTFSADSTVAYQMCGFGSTQQNCGIAAGQPSVRRGRLLRREALELALYTLKYVPGTDAVLTYLPPPASQASPTSVLVARKDVAKDLDRPLDRTLTPEKRIVLGKRLPDGAKVDKLTISRLFTYDYQTLPGDGTAILVLTAAITPK
ncbi:MAG TPA: hypothetical protein VFU56_07870 [Gaiellaceae bacterium]|nr:hypothetical protein [Gaiellaceae bacterium]